MKAYGVEAGDTDVDGCRRNGRKTGIYRVDGRAYRSLRDGKKAAVRRRIKQIARAGGKRAGTNFLP